MGRWDALAPSSSKEKKARNSCSKKPCISNAGTPRAEHFEGKSRQDGTPSTNLPQARSSRHMIKEFTSQEITAYLETKVMPQMLQGNTDLEDGLATIQISLQHHASAVMAPLTEGVSKEGVEMMIENPCRLLIFRVLQFALLKTPTAATTLIQTFRVARNLEGQKCHAYGTIRDVDATVILKYLKRSQQKNWQVLLAYLQRHPDASVSFVPDILLDRNADFLQTFREKLSPASEILAIVIAHWPLTLWLKNTRSAPTLYQDRVVQGLLTLINATRHWLGSVASKPRQLVDVAQGLLRHVPFLETLHGVGLNLVRHIAQAAIASSQEALAAFVDLCGGRTTPQGQTVPMSPYLRSWLDNQDGVEWIEKLVGINLAKPRNGRKVYSAPEQMLVAVLETHPNAVLLSAKASFQDAVQALCRNMETRTQGVSLLQALLRGRSKLVADGGVLTANPTLWASPLLMGALGLKNGSTCRAIAVAAFGCFAIHDWEVQSRTDFCEMIKLTLSLCSDANVGSKWRSSSLKSLGDICTNSLATQLPSAHLLNQILAMLVTTIDDKNADVRCMSLFATGNLFIVLQQTQDAENVRDEDRMHCLTGLSDKVFARLQDNNEKVVSNAIRSVGHLARFLLEQHEAFRSCDFQPTNFVRDVIRALISKVDAALAQAGCKEERNKNQLSWKERTALKKHCWGSCNAFASIFHAEAKHLSDLSECVTNAISSILGCVKQWDSLSEKAVLSASKALRTIHLERSMLPDTTYFTEALVSTVHFLRLQDQKSPVSRLCEELELLLRTMLLHVTAVDAVAIIQHSQNRQHFDDDLLPFLFSHMSCREYPPEAFIPFSVAAQKPGVHIDIQIEQILYSRRCAQREDDDEL